ncbi:MAG: Ku-like_protein [uncultured Phycisphaerae bacterium]|uniref:Non-homologous end joining protein Ku n=1 Tax=uncultured Phycisphaerae bacterium TaxID=904963 RepID=A0A6J4N0P9_9BACT|nr:MAG: Ku-like_protein [uncultured Phycisphaerae bacterium]
MRGSDRRRNRRFLASSRVVAPRSAARADVCPANANGKANLMARALWKAVLEYGAISVPVKLYTAVRPQEIRFHMLHDQDGARLRQQMVCPAEGDHEVPREHVVKGYELQKGQYVVVHEHEIEECSPLASRAIEVRRFVDPAQIDPLFYEKAYYLGPDEHGHKPYALLAAAMRQERRVAVVEFVMRGKQYLGAVRATDGEPGGGGEGGEGGESVGGRGAAVLVLETMRYADEVIPTGEIESEIRKLKVDERQVKMAEQLIETLAADFEPALHKDEYQACVMAMIESKARGERIEVSKPAGPKVTKAPDLTETLRASLAHAKARRTAVIEHPAERRTPRA